VENVQNAPNAQNVQKTLNVGEIQNAILINISVKIRIGNILINLEKIRGL
jgi:hypothetical protein